MSQYSRLILHLAGEAQDKGDGTAELAEALGIGRSYLYQLLTGKKGTARLGREILVSAAKYLDVPVAQAYLWSSALEPTDFVHKTKFEAASGDLLDVMSGHPVWGGFMPSPKEWDSLSARSRLALVSLFEAATGTEILDKTAKTMLNIP